MHEFVLFGCIHPETYPLLDEKTYSIGEIRCQKNRSISFYSILFCFVLFDIRASLFYKIQESTKAKNVSILKGIPDELGYLGASCSSADCNSIWTYSPF